MQPRWRGGGADTETRSSGTDNEGELTAEGIYSAQKTTAGRSSSYSGNESESVAVKGLSDSSFTLNVSLYLWLWCKLPNDILFPF